MKSEVLVWDQPQAQEDSHVPHSVHLRAQEHSEAPQASCAGERDPLPQESKHGKAGPVRPQLEAVELGCTSLPGHSSWGPQCGCAESGGRQGGLCSILH